MFVFFVIILAPFLVFMFIALNKRRLLKASVILFCILFISVSSLYLFLPKIVEAFVVRINPRAFEGTIGIIGVITMNDSGDMYFIIDECRRRKMVLPVRYIGDKHVDKTKVIAYGRLQKEAAGGYRFRANEIIPKDDDLSGSIIYSSRKLLEKPRSWIYANFPAVEKMKKRLSQG